MCGSLTEDCKARIEYISEVTGLYFIEDVSFTNSGYKVFNSIPLLESNIIVIVGHNFRVLAFLKEFKDDIYESNVVLVSCYLKKMRDLIEYDKNVYISHQTVTNSTETLVGTDYGFDFNPTCSELDLYNSKGDLLQRIEFSFEKR